MKGKIIKKSGMGVQDTQADNLLIYHFISYGRPVYHIISYLIVSYHIISYHTISYYIILYYITSYRIISLSYHKSYHTISHIISYHIISNHIISYHIVSHYQRKAEKMSKQSSGMIHQVRSDAQTCITNFSGIREDNDC